MARKYGKAASRKVKRALHERKAGTLRSGRSGRKVRSRRQAIAIGLSEARRAGAKVPRRRKAKKPARKKKVKTPQDLAPAPSHHPTTVHPFESTGCHR
jgi:hypothetical protein